MSQTKVAILMGSKSDLSIMNEAVEALNELGMGSEVRILSAHRTPDQAVEFSKNARSNGFSAIIAGAGGAAHLPGVLAAYTDLPVIGVPIGNGPLQGQDSLHSIVQMPRGIPVATVAINGAFNAGLLAGHIVAASQTAEGEAVLGKIREYRAKMREKILSTQP